MTGPHHNLPTLPGYRLPPTLWHHHNRDEAGVADHPDYFRQPANVIEMPRPRGGLFTHPMTARRRTWMGNIRARTTWSDWCTETGNPVKPWCTYVIPHTNAQFLHLRNGEDVLNLFHALPWRKDAPPPVLSPDIDNPLAALLAFRIDWARLTRLRVSGVYITQGALDDCASDYGTDTGPGLGTWTVPTVWYCQANFRMGATWHWHP